MLAYEVLICWLSMKQSAAEDYRMLKKLMVMLLLVTEGVEDHHSGERETVFEDI